MDNIDIIFDELKRNEIDIDKHTLSFHINTIYTDACIKVVNSNQS